MYFDAFFPDESRSFLLHRPPYFDDQLVNFT